MNDSKTKFQDILNFTYDVFRWAFFSTLIGIPCGILGTLFHYFVHYCDHMLGIHPEILYFMPLGGLLITYLYHLLGTEGLNTDSAIKSAYTSEPIRFLLIPAIFISTGITHLVGGSAGKEGAALQIGAVIGNKIGRIFKLGKEEICILTMSGMAAFFAAIFGMPVTATIFVSMVINAGSFWVASVFPEFAASLIAAGISYYFKVEPMRFHVVIPELHPGVIIKVIIVAGLCALISEVFCEMLHGTEHLLAKIFKNNYVRIFVVSIVLILIMKATGTLDYCGSGDNIIRAYIELGSTDPKVFLLKLLLTCLTLGAGFKGGEVFPSFAIGSAFGGFIAPFVGLSPMFGASIGLLCVFVGCTNSLIAPMFLAVELFGSDGLIFYSLACIISFMFSGYGGFYYNQTILYSKIRPKIINLRRSDRHQ